LQGISFVVFLLENALRHGVTKLPGQFHACDITNPTTSKSKQDFFRDIPLTIKANT